VNNIGRSVLLWGFILVLIIVLINMFQGSSPAANQKIAYSEFLNQVDQGRVESVQIKGNNTIVGEFRDKTAFKTVMPIQDATLTDRLQSQNVVWEVEEQSSNLFAAILMNALPILLLIAVWIFFMRQMQGGGRGGAMGFGKSRAKLLTEKHGRVTFADVAGIDEAKEELQEIVEFLRDPDKFQRLGGKIPKGGLLIGPPGTGKTLLARAIAGEANVPFFTISGSDFVEMFVGVGASRVRDMFEQAKKNAPCIIFIDEIDAVGRHRGAGLGGGNDEREQTLNQLLVEMDGFESNEGIILIAATNRPDVLDPALLRPGRFDRQVVVPNPDIVGREKILLVHMAKVPLAGDVNARVIARGTPGFSGADLANLVNEAALLAARKGKRLVSMLDFESAKDKVMMGAERRSMVMTEEEKALTAYHEAGHALVGLYVPGNDPLHKVSIIPRGRALGVTFNLPERDRYSMKKMEMEARLAMMFGGRVAEQIIFGDENVTTGASNDIMQATKLARSMVTEYGMSDKLGPQRYDENQDEVFLGHSVARTQSVSEATAQLIDQEVRRIIDEGEAKARQVLTDHMKDLHALAEGLLEYETLSGDEVQSLLRGDGVSRPDAPSEPPRPSGTTAVPTAGKKAKPSAPLGGDAEPQPEG